MGPQPNIKTKWIAFSSLASSCASHYVCVSKRCVHSQDNGHLSGVFGTKLHNIPNYQYEAIPVVTKSTSSNIGQSSLPKAGREPRTTQENSSRDCKKKWFLWIWSYLHKIMPKTYVTPSKFHASRNNVMHTSKPSTNTVFDIVLYVNKPE